MNLMEKPFISFLIENEAVSKESLEKIVPSNGGCGESFHREDCWSPQGLMTEEELKAFIERFYGVPIATLQ